MDHSVLVQDMGEAVWGQNQDIARHEEACEEPACVAASAGGRSLDSFEVVSEVVEELLTCHQNQEAT